MPYPSTFPPIAIPDVDLWTLLCERTDKPFASSKGRKLGLA